MHTVDAGDIDWSFTIAEPSGQLYTAAYAPSRCRRRGLVFPYSPADHHLHPATNAHGGRGRHWLDVYHSPANGHVCPTTHAHGGCRGCSRGLLLFFRTSSFTYTAPPMHTVDAGDVSWIFAVPRPTVTYTPPTLDHTVNAGDVGWSFNVRRPTVSYFAPVTSFFLQIDWAGDGSFSHPDSDVSADVVADIDCTRGRGDYGSQLFGRSVRPAFSARG